jgi:hypothetical protein
VIDSRNKARQLNSIVGNGLISFLDEAPEVAASPCITVKGPDDPVLAEKLKAEDLKRVQKNRYYAIKGGLAKKRNAR